MKKVISMVLLVVPLLMSGALAQVRETALTCSDFNPTPEALERFKDLKGACEAVVERNGELYGRFKAVVRRASGRSVTLYLPATDHTFRVQPDSEMRVLMGGKKVRPRDLQRGDEIRIYLSTTAFSTPDIEEITLVTETEAVVTHPVVPEPALPTTASPWPNLALISLGLLAFGYALRRFRLSGVERR